LPENEGAMRPTIGRSGSSIGTFLIDPFSDYYTSAALFIND